MRAHLNTNNEEALRCLLGFIADDPTATYALSRGIFIYKHIDKVYDWTRILWNITDVHKINTDKSIDLLILPRDQIRSIAKAYIIERDEEYAYAYTPIRRSFGSCSPLDVVNPLFF